ncbi:MAG TPA: helix-turn-helix transcriptional regulator [Solirubrobacteraceae bacterium]|jgi:DNA-binding CsgD family transcriptional regulator|nr:helix-turn-helix transcriptional regulator [Solirubrobacteraceae bacterium]
MGAAAGDAGRQRVREPAVCDLGEGDVVTVADQIAPASCCTPTDGATWFPCGAALRVPERAEQLYLEAIGQLDGTAMRIDSAGSKLLFGEWLRRANRHVDARLHLRAAHEMSAAMGADAFVERARRWLLATGERVRRHSVETRDDLSPQEAQIARLARDGLTNPEIGPRLFLGPRTVEWHLRKVFRKLGIDSRRGLLATLSRHGVVSQGDVFGRGPWLSVVAPIRPVILAQ